MGLDTDCLLQSICSVLHSKEQTREELYTAQEGSDGLPEFHGEQLLGAECFGAGNTLCQTCGEDRAVETSSPISKLIPRTNIHRGKKNGGSGTKIARPCLLTHVTNGGAALRRTSPKPLTNGARAHANRPKRRQGLHC